MKQITTPNSLMKIAFDTIKKAIISGEFRPGNIYSEQWLSQEMSISKTPIHQALLDLEGKGFVTILPRRGFQVNKLSRRTISNMFELRRSLERTVLIIVTHKLTAQDIQQLEGILNQTPQARNQGEFLEYDRAFHRYLARLSDNEFIINALDTVWDLSDWVGGGIRYGAQTFSQICKEHRNILEMMKMDNAELAAAAMIRHLNSTETRFIKASMAE